MAEKDTAPSEVPSTLGTNLAEISNCPADLKQMAAERDLAYKPVVNACGHLFCFWCFHSTMNSISESHCPLCRRAYSHFPRFCEQLHFYLQKCLPEDYRLRAKEIEENEKQTGMFSPEVTNWLEETDFQSSESDEAQRRHRLEETKTTTVETNKSLESASHLVDYELICRCCSSLLYKPVVLNCGHLFCQSCINYSMGAKLQCQTCGKPHPSRIPLVCVELQSFLESAFPLQYLQRKQQIGSGRIIRLQTGCSEENPDNAIQDDRKSEGAVLDGDTHSSAVHLGVGCDSCGIQPIIGRRFKCMECPELIGFDLCQNCYESNDDQKGRFNQRHTRDHVMKEVGTSTGADFLLHEGSISFENEMGWGIQFGGGVIQINFNPYEIEEQSVFLKNEKLTSADGSDDETEI